MDVRVLFLNGVWIDSGSYQGFYHVRPPVVSHVLMYALRCSAGCGWNRAQLPGFLPGPVPNLTSSSLLYIDVRFMLFPGTRPSTLPGLQWLSY